MSERTPPASLREDQIPMLITSSFKPFSRPAPSSSEPVDPVALHGLSVAGGPVNASSSTSPIVLPFRRRSVRQPSDRNLEQAVAMAVRLLVAGRVDDAEHRFRALATVARSWDMGERQAAWQLPSWVGVVVCHALRGEWLSAEMAAREQLSELSVAGVPDAYIAAVALGNEWLVNVPEHHIHLGDGGRPTELRRFPRSTPPRESANADPARDYAYALVSALRFRLGCGVA